MKIELQSHPLGECSQIIIADSSSKFEKENFSEDEINYIKKSKELKTNVILINRFQYQIFICFVAEDKKEHFFPESVRVLAVEVLKTVNNHKIEKIFLQNKCENPKTTTFFLEGFELASYQFLKYFSKENIHKKQNSLKELFIENKNITLAEIEEIKAINQSVFLCRNLVNEPPSYQTINVFAKQIAETAQKCGFEAEILDFDKIKTLRMGGLIAVNKASAQKAKFVILSWKPQNAKNEKPYIFVGKGITFDTGGYNLKPDLLQDTMKCDMAGAATVTALFAALAQLNLPVFAHGLIPITDNKINENGYTMGDIITMHSGTSVEITHTDAEGRLILADALSFAKKYNPELVVDIATLTGSAQNALANEAMVAMNTANDNIFNKLKQAANETYERIVEFPLWEEYAEMLKSDIADLKNASFGKAGAITAAKFLQHFTDYQWIHLDIAGVAFFNKPKKYHPAGGTGIGVRLLVKFLQNL